MDTFLSVLDAATSSEYVARASQAQPTATGESIPSATTTTDQQPAAQAALPDSAPTSETASAPQGTPPPSPKPESPDKTGEPSQGQNNNLGQKVFFVIFSGGALGTGAYYGYPIWEEYEKRRKADQKKAEARRKKEESLRHTIKTMPLAELHAYNAITNQLQLLDLQPVNQSSSRKKTDLLQQKNAILRRNGHSFA